MTAMTFTPTATSVPARARRSVPWQTATVAVPTTVPMAATPGWIERLAMWADAHPPRHHRLGRWTLNR